MFGAANKLLTGILKKKPRGFSSKHPLSVRLEQNPCLSWVTQGQGVCSSVIYAGVLIDLPASVVFAVKLGWKAAVPPLSILFNHAEQGPVKTWGGWWEEGRLRAYACCRNQSRQP